MNTFFDEVDIPLNCALYSAIAEMHIIAYCYNWSRDSLWDMSRSERKVWAEMVKMQKKAEADSIKGGTSGDNTAPRSSKKGYSESS